MDRRLDCGGEALVVRHFLDTAVGPQRPAVTRESQTHRLSSQTHSIAEDRDTGRAICDPY